MSHCKQKHTLKKSPSPSGSVLVLLRTILDTGPPVFGKYCDFSKEEAIITCCPLEPGWIRGPFPLESPRSTARPSSWAADDRAALRESQACSAIRGRAALLPGAGRAPRGRCSLPARPGAVMSWDPRLGEMKGIQRGPLAPGTASSAQSGRSVGTRALRSRHSARAGGTAGPTGCKEKGGKQRDPGQTKESEDGEAGGRLPAERSVPGTLRAHTQTWPAFDVLQLITDQITGISSRCSSAFDLQGSFSSPGLEDSSGLALTYILGKVELLAQKRCQGETQLPKRVSTAKSSAR